MNIKFTKQFHSVAMLICASFIFLPHSSFAQEEVTVMLPGEVPMVMVKVPAGTFLMGSPSGERGNIFDNEDQHQVTLTQDYYLGKTEVTQKQWEAVMGTPMPDCCSVPGTSCGTPGGFGDDYPVNCVTWNDMAGPGGFAEKLNLHLQTDTFRLPREAEWEHAARAGTTTRFSHGDILQCGDDCEACAEHDPSMWFCGNDSTAGPKPVGQLLANQFGLHDMHGNIFELVNDLYEPEYGSAVGQPVTDPTGPASNSNGDIVFRSGGARSEVWLARSAARLGGSPSQTNNEIGFRIAASHLDSPAFQINPGLNGSWANFNTLGQGFFIDVLPDIPLIFLAWFTWETDQAAPAQSKNPGQQLTSSGSNSQAVVGDDNHRWLTAQGAFADNAAQLDVTLTAGGLFDNPQPVTNSEMGTQGTITLTFTDCKTGTVDYDFTAIGMSGSVPIQRLAEDNVALCETMDGIGDDPQ